MNRQHPTDRSASANSRAFAQHNLTQPQALLLFTQRLAALIEAHIAMARILEILQDSPAPYGAASERLMGEIVAGDTVCNALTQEQRDEQAQTWWLPIALHRAMARQPESFSPIYIAVVRAGEIGGTVDETLRGLAAALARESRLFTDYPAGAEDALLTRPSSLPKLQDWRELSGYQQSATLALLFRTTGMLLSSGVPLLSAMEIAADLLPQRQSEEFLQIRSEIRDGAPLLAFPVERLHFVPRFALEIACLGQLRGNLDSALQDVAQVLEQEMDYLLQ